MSTKSNDWIERKVQEHGNGYFRVNVPKSFAEGHQKVEYKEVENGLIIRPSKIEEGWDVVIKPNLEGKRTEATLELPEYILEDLNQQGSSLMEEILDMMLQCYWIANVDDINIETPGVDKDDELWDHLDSALTKSQLFSIAEWDNKESVFSIKREITIEEYEKYTIDFVNLYLINLIKELQKDGFSERELQNMKSRENELDREWALATKDNVNKVMELQISEYSPSFSNMNIAKYLERTADCTEELTELLFEFDKENEDNPKMRDKVFNRLDEVFIQNHRFNHHLEEVSEKSRNREVDARYLNEQVKISERKKERLDDLKDEIDGNGTILLGEIISKSKQLVRFPRSIAVAGFGGRHFSEALEDRNIREY